MSDKENRSKVCFLLTHIPNPRMNKRIGAFKSKMPVEVICARRASQNIWEPEHKDVEHTIIDVDLPEMHHIFKRVLVSKNFRKTLYRNLVDKRPEIVYAEGLDTLMVANRYKKKYGGKVIFEVADLREFFIEKPKGFGSNSIAFAISTMEKRLFKKVDRLVITSPKFYELHYRNLISEDKTVFVPNAPDLTAFRYYRHKEGGEFTVGFIGGIRYFEQMKMLVDAASDLGIRVLFAGAGGTSNDYTRITDYCKGKENITFTGRYDYASDIAKLYGMADCVYSVYDVSNPNVRIALPNKLYEAVYCRLPIIVAKGTYLEELVREWGVGLSVGYTDVDELKDALEKLRCDRNLYDDIVKACDSKRADIVKMREFDLVDALL